jgi:CO dehydrogenase maturation factor
MRIAFVGKGGSGKTTLASLLARWLAARGRSVLAIDADINQHLGVALGLSRAEAAALPAMGEELVAIKEYLRGANPRISSAETMVKTTPPGRGSRLLRLGERSPLYDRLQRTTPDGVRLMVTGPFAERDLGVACYHAKVGAAELLLNHLVDLPGEYVVVDMTAGADSFASGMFTRFDLTALVVEPTRRAVGVYEQYLGYAAGFDVAIRVLGNKVQDREDVEFLRDQVGGALLGWFGHSALVRSMEKGRFPALAGLEPANLEVLAALAAELDAQTRDWSRFHRQTVDFHLRNAISWANATVGEDLTAQVDPDFQVGAALAVAPGPA